MATNRWDSTIYWDSTYTWGGGELDEFTWDPQYIFSEIVGFMTNVFLMDSGKEVRYSKGEPRREFNLVFQAIDDDDKDGIVDFYNDHEGRNTSFYWENPNDSVYYEVRFKADSLEINYIDYGMYDIRLSFMEII